MKEEKIEMKTEKELDNEIDEGNITPDYKEGYLEAIKEIILLIEKHKNCVSFHEIKDELNNVHPATCLDVILKEQK